MFVLKQLEKALMVEKSLKEYVDNEQDSIYAMAKGVNPIKALMGDKGK